MINCLKLKKFQRKFDYSYKKFNNLNELILIITNKSSRRLQSKIIFLLAKFAITDK